MPSVDRLQLSGSHYFDSSSVELTSCYAFRSIGQLEDDYLAVSHLLFIEPTMVGVERQLVRFIEIVWKYDICCYQIPLRNRPEVAQRQWRILQRKCDWAPNAEHFDTLAWNLVQPHEQHGQRTS